MSLSLFLWFFTAYLKDFLDSLSETKGVHTVGHSYLQCKHTHKHTQPLTVGKLLINECVDSGSAAVCYSPALWFFPLRDVYTWVRLAFQRLHLDLHQELRKGKQCGSACGKSCACDVVVEWAHDMLLYLLMRWLDSRLKNVCLINTWYG